MYQKEHGVDPQAKGQEWHNLGGGGVEVDPNESCQAQPGADVDGDQEDAGNAQSGLRSHSVSPPVQGGSSVEDLKGRVSNCEDNERK